MISLHSYLVYTYEQKIFIDEIQVYSRRHIQLSSTRAYSGGPPNILVSRYFIGRKDSLWSVMAVIVYIYIPTTDAYMPTLPIYAVVYRIFKSSTDFRCFPTDLKRKNVKKIIVNCSYVDYSCRFLRRINKSKLFWPFL